MFNERHLIITIKDFDQTFSRRGLLKTVGAAIGGAFAVVCMAIPAEAKMTQKAAGYQATPKDGQNCANCAVFKPPSSCTLVDGTVTPTGWCRFYTKKTS